MDASATHIWADGDGGGLCSPSLDCVKILNADGVLQHFNDDGLRLMEIDSIEQVRGRSWADLWPEGSKVLVAQALATARTAGTASFSAPCPTAKGAPKWWHVTVAAMPGTNGNIVVVSRDITQERTESGARDLERKRLASILRSNADVLWDIDLPRDQVWWGEGMTSTFGYGPDQIGDTTGWCHDHIHPDDRERVVAGMAEAVQSGAPTWEDDFRYRRADGSYVEVYDRGAIIRDVDGTAQRFVGVMQDVTARNAVGDAYKALAGEMAHRVNNVIAVVTGLFQQTVQKSDTVESIVSAFQSRLKAMASANTAIMRTAGKGASLSDLAEVQLAPFVSAGRMRIIGGALIVPERLAQPLALAFNELATNAIKYGALSNDNGLVDLTWTLSIENGATMLEIVWTESGGPLVSIPTRTGVGSRLIDRGISGAVVDRHFPPEGFRCSIRVPVRA